MTYEDGSLVGLGDLVTVPIPSGRAEARVVMLGEDYSHLNIDEQFISWVTKDRVLAPDSVVIEWTGQNPFAHDDPSYAPAGNYMFTPLDEHVLRVLDK